MKAKFYRQFYLFAIYFVISLFAFGLRPKAIGDGDDDDTEKNRNRTREVTMNETTNAPVKSPYNLHNLTEILCNYSAIHEAIVQTDISTTNTTELYENSTMPMDDSGEWTSFSECPLLDISTLTNRVSMNININNCHDSDTIFVDKTWC